VAGRGLTLSPSQTSLLLPLNLPPVVASIRAPGSVGLCGSLDLDASGSTGAWAPRAARRGCA
jgi:hypothetical protein